MQELIYTNLQGESACFGAAPPWILASLKGTESSDFTRKTVKGALQHGEQTASLLRQDRRLELTLNLFTFSRGDMYRQREALCGILSAEKAFDPVTGDRAKVVYHNDHGIWWTWAMPSGAPKWGKRIQNIQPSLKLSFDCDSPYWFSMEEQKGSFDISEDGFRFPIRFPVRFASRALDASMVNGGQAPAPLYIEILGQGEKPSLINQTTGKKLRLVSPLPVGTMLKISTDPDALYVRMVTEGVESNAFGLLDVTTPLTDFMLVPGVNVIAYDAGGAMAKTAIGMRWQDRFEGV